jgi:hypothetical protein
MRYSKRNVAVLLARLRVMGLDEPGYWADVFKPNTFTVAAMRWKPYSKMEKYEQKANWQQFQQDVNRLTNTNRISAK